MRKQVSYKVNSKLLVLEQMNFTCLRQPQFNLFLASIRLWHHIGNTLYMKVLKLKTDREANTTESFIAEMLRRDWNAFKATSKQFLRNNKAYHQQFTGLIA